MRLRPLGQTVPEFCDEILAYIVSCLVEKFFPTIDDWDPLTMNPSLLLLLLLLLSRFHPSSPTPYLLGYSASNATPALQRHFHPTSSPPLPHHAALARAQAHATNNDYFMSIKAHEAMLPPSYLYSRMGPQTRYRTHLSLSAVLLRAGLYARAEQTLYEATSLVDEPHEAYRGLALVATQQGRWGEAVAHWKNCLFLAPKGSPGESEYLQRLGALLILDGSVNEGRHYLSRAVSQWQRGAGTPGRRGGGSPSESTPSEGLGQMYSWMVTYLLGTLDMDWQPPGQLPAAGAGASEASNAANTTLPPALHGHGADQTTAEEKQLLTELVDHPSILNGRAFFDLGQGLWEAGAAEAAARHMKRGLAMAATGSFEQLHAMRLRVALDFPWTVGTGPSPAAGAPLACAAVGGACGFDEGAWAEFRERLSEYEEQVGLAPLAPPPSPAEVAGLQVQPMDMLDLVTTLGAASWHGHVRVSLMLRRVSRLFRLHCSALLPTPPPLPPRDVTVVRKRKRKKHQHSNIDEQPRTVDVVRIGIVSALLCEHPAGKVLLAAALALGKRGSAAPDGSEAGTGASGGTRPKVQLTLFAFPTAVDPWSYNITAQAHHYVRLRSGDWLEARRQILQRRLDCVLFADWNDAATMLLGHHRLAPLQLVLVAKGAPAGLPAADYYLVSEYHDFSSAGVALTPGRRRREVHDEQRGAAPEGGGEAYDSGFGEQVVTLEGLGVAWSDFQQALRLVDATNQVRQAHPVAPPAGEADLNARPLAPSPLSSPPPFNPLTGSGPISAAPLRYEYYGHYFFQSENIYVVAAPVQAMRRSFDLVLARLLLVDPKGVLVFLGDPAEVPEIAIAPASVSPPSSSRPLSSGLVSPAQWYQRFVGRLLSHELLRGDRNVGQRVRLLPRLDHAGRLDLLRIADAILDPAPVGLTLPSLDAIAIGTPVVTVGRTAPLSAAAPESTGNGHPLSTEHGFAANFLTDVFSTRTGGPNAGLDCCVATTVDGYISAAVRLGTDPEYKLRVQRTIRRKLSAWADISEAARTNSLADFILGAATANRRQQRSSSRLRTKRKIEGREGEGASS